MPYIVVPSVIYGTSARAGCVVATQLVARLPKLLPSGTVLSVNETANQTWC